MGALQQQPCDIWLTIERNPAHLQKDLFDFTSKRQTVTSVKISYPSNVLLNDRTNQVKYSLLPEPHNQMFSFFLKNSEPHQMVLRLSPRQDRETIWKYLSDGQSSQLEQGDRLKLGRIALYLKELRYIQPRPSSNISQKNQDMKSIRPSVKGHQETPLKNSGYFQQYQTHKMRDSQLYTMKKSDMLMGKSGVSIYSNAQKSCRICFDSKDTTSNPLFNVCLCSGTVKFIHFECLKSWFRSKTVKFEAPHCLYFCYEPMQCQICKYAISNEVVHYGRKYCLYEYEQIHPPFAKFQHYSDNKVFQILIRLEQSLKISVGRGAQNDLNLNDSSVSRFHCQLEYSQQKLTVKAQGCKYGTFVELGKNLQLGLQPIGLSISNSLVWLQRRVRPGNHGGCCSSQGKSLLLIQ